MNRILLPAKGSTKRHVSGAGLVEIMVALTVGLFLMGGVIQIYLGSKQSYNTAENLSRMQENLRFAAEMIAADIRMAGFMPCRMTDRTVNVLNSGPGNNFFTHGISGLDGDHADSPPTGVANHGSGAISNGAGQLYEKWKTGTDIVSVLRGGEDSFSVVDHNATAAQFKINKLSTLADGDIVLVCDMIQSSVFQITQTSSTNVTIVHNTGTNPAPGNCTKGLGYPLPAPPPNCTTNGTPYEYGPDSHLVTLEEYHYFIGNNAAAVPTLYKGRLISTAGSQSLAAQELVEGIEDMQVLYGVDGDGDGNPDRFVRADEVLDVTGASWNSVVAVRLGFLAQTPEEVAQSTDTRSYNLAGTSITGTSDRRQRYVYNTTIKIRNRGQL